MNDESFALIVQRYAEGVITAAERKALTETVQADPGRRAQFARQVRLSLELGALLTTEDAEDAHLRASLIVSEDADARDRRVMASLEKRLRIGAWRGEARKSSRSIPVVREPAARMPSKRGALIAAAVLIGVAGLAAAVFFGGSEEPLRKTAGPSRATAPVEPVPGAVREGPKAADLEAERERRQAEAKQRERARRIADEREALNHNPAPEEPKAPDPDAVKAATPRKPTTVVAMARLVAVTGNVSILAGGRKIPAKAGQDLLSGQGIETTGTLSWAALRFADGTRLELWADTRIPQITEPSDPSATVGKQAFVTEGTLLGAVAKQPKDRPFVMTTPQGEAKVLGTVLSISVEPDGIGSTRLEVGEGRVQFKESVNQKAIDVTTGLYTVASGGAEMTLKNIPPLPLRRRPAPPYTGLDPARIDAAVRRAVEFLKTAESPAMNGNPDSDELILWTFIQAGVEPFDPKYQQMLMKILDERRETATYSIAVRAMILEELNRNAYQGQLLRCAQVLVDNQCPNGQWDYRVVTEGREDAPELIPVSPDPSRKARAIQRFAVRKRRDGPAVGDNSNSYYAALGLRACHDAGIVIPEEVVERARTWWVKTQFPDEANAPSGAVRGWGYGYSKGGHPRTAAPYGSITAGGVGSVAIYDFMRVVDWKKDPTVKAGLNWLANRYGATENPGCPPDEMGRMYHHYLVSLERTGVMLGTETYGRNAWYPEAAKRLLDAQRPDGSWNAGWETTWDTCFAVLFLKRAGRGLDD